MIAQIYRIRCEHIILSDKRNVSGSKQQYLQMNHLAVLFLMKYKVLDIASRTWESNPDLWVSSQKLWPLDHRGGRININATKFVQLTFTLRKEQCPIVYINNAEIPQSPTVKYLGLHLDSRLTWTQHLAKKKKTDRTKGKRLVLGHRKKISRIARKQSTSIQDNHKAYLDLRNRTMGMRQQIAYSQNATKPVQNTADDHKCALVCD
jgi:hypothetical protein